VSIQIPRQDGVEKWAFNEVHFEIQRLLDRIRQNEGMDTFLLRKDSEDAMVIEVGFSDHGAKRAIIRELTTKASNAANCYGIKKIYVFVEEGLLDDLKVALEMKKVARVLCGA
jgi:phenylpyruvate tautomerase PptA (4-oxalocrotonate tautomerase family)